MNRMEMQYIGVCCLLARLSPNIENADDKSCIECALNDFVNTLTGRFEKVKIQNGWALEPVKGGHK